MPASFVDSRSGSTGGYCIQRGDDGGDDMRPGRIDYGAGNGGIRLLEAKYV